MCAQPNNLIFLLCCRPNATVLEQFQLSISRMEMYKEDDPLVERLLDNMAKNKIVHVSK